MSDIKIGIVITLKICVTKTLTEANCESPPNLVVNMGVVEADGMADCRTMTARESGERKPKRPVTNKTKAGTNISLQKINKIMGFLYERSFSKSHLDIIEPITISARGIVAEPSIFVDSSIKTGSLTAARPTIMPEIRPIVPLFIRFFRFEAAFLP